MRARVAILHECLAPTSSVHVAPTFTQPLTHGLRARPTSTFARAHQANKEAISKREAASLEALLNLRTAQNQTSAWMDYVQRELAQVKVAATQARTRRR